MTEVLKTVPEDMTEAGTACPRFRAEASLEIDESGPCIIRAPRGHKRRMVVTLGVTLLLFIVPAAWMGRWDLALAVACVPVLLYLSTFWAVTEIRIEGLPAETMLRASRRYLLRRVALSATPLRDIQEVCVRPASEVSYEHTYMRPFSLVLSVFALHVLFPSMRVPVEVWDLVVRTSPGETALLITTHDRAAAERARDELAGKIGVRR